jgi:hypothetical protein
VHQRSQSCDYGDNKEISAWLNNVLRKKATEDWRKVSKKRPMKTPPNARNDGILQAADELAGGTKQSG